MADQEEFASAMADRRKAANTASYKSIVAMLIAVGMILCCGGVMRGVYSQQKGHEVVQSPR